MKQTVVVAENKIGMLSSILRILSENNINIRSLSTERGKLSEIRLILDNPEEAKTILEEHGFTSHIVEIVVVELDDNPGQLANICGILEDENINIDYIYGIDNGKENKGLFAIKTSTELLELKNLLSDFSLL